MIPRPAAYDGVVLPLLLLLGLPMIRATLTSFEGFSQG